MWQCKSCSIANHAVSMGMVYEILVLQYLIRTRVAFVECTHVQSISGIHSQIAYWMLAIVSVILTMMGGHNEV